MQVKKQQLELDMEQQTGSKSGKEYVKAVYRHPAAAKSLQLCPTVQPHRRQPTRLPHPWGKNTGVGYSSNGRFTELLPLEKKIMAQCSD